MLIVITYYVLQDYTLQQDMMNNAKLYYQKYYSLESDRIFGVAKYVILFADFLKTNNTNLYRLEN